MVKSFEGKMAFTLDEFGQRTEDRFRETALCVGGIMRALAAIITTIADTDEATRERLVSELENALDGSDSEPSKDMVMMLLPFARGEGRYRPADTDDE